MRVESGLGYVYDDYIGIPDHASSIWFKNIEI
jgi:hypothetical protein